MNVNIKIYFHNTQEIQCEIYYNNMLVSSDGLKYLLLTVAPTYLFPWLLNICRVIFNFPLQTEINFNIIGDKTLSDPLLPLFQTIINVLQGTRRAILKSSQFQIDSLHFSNKLFLNLGETPFVKRIYEEAYQRDPQHTFYDTCDFLNDPLNTQSSSSTLEGLLTTISEKKIKHVYIHNFSLLNYYLGNYQIHLTTIFEKLGLELIILDFDTYDQREGEIYLKKLYHSDLSRHYCVMPHVESTWDHEMKLENIHYFTFPYKIDCTTTKNISGNYEILITTWARLNHLFHFFKPVLLFLTYVDFSKPFLDFQILFHGLRTLLRNNHLIPRAIKMRYNTLIADMFYQSNTLLKFETLHTLKTNRKVNLYGESDWNEFFPQYYQGQVHQNDLNKMLSEKSFLQLLMNPNYSYLENNPMFMRLLNSGYPYLGFSSLLRTPELEGMTVLEFSHGGELNQKIEQLPQLMTQESLLKSKNHLATLINTSLDDFYQNALSPPQPRIGKNYFEGITEPYSRLFEEQFLDAPRFKECLDRLLREDFHHITPENSPLMDRPYFQKMVTLYKQFQVGK